MKRHSYLVLSIACLSLMSMVSNSQVTQDWTQIYNGPPVGSHVPTSIATDSSGNSYVGGWSSLSNSQSGSAVVKYAPNGQQSWAMRYDPVTPNAFSFVALCVDAAGSVRFTGYRHDPVTNGYNFVTARLNLDGSVQWMRDTMGVKGVNTPIAIALDSEGNTYVSGKSTNPLTGEVEDFLTIKYSQDGTELWKRYYSFATGSREALTALKIDKDDNAIITGISTPFSVYKIVTIKYDYDGNEQWVRTEQHGTDTTFPFDVAADTEGNVIVAGAYESSTFNYLTIKYDSKGTKLWEKTQSLQERPAKVSTDSQGNVIVIGRTFDAVSHSLNWIVLKYSSAGTLLWSSQFNGDANGQDEARDLAIDSQDTIYVTGLSYAGAGSTTYHGLTIKYRPDGSEVWRKFLDVGLDYREPHLALGAQNSVYVTATFGLSRTLKKRLTNFYTVKYVQN